MGEIRASDARGQLIAAHDPRAEVWTAETTADTADTIPGRVVPPAAGSQGRMVATGDQDGTDTIGIKVLRGGSVGSRVEVGWKKTADTHYHGVNSPTIPTWSESVYQTADAATTAQFDSPRAVVLDDQRILVALSQYSSAFTGSTPPNYYVTIRSASGTWQTTPSAVYANSSVGSTVQIPTYVGCPGLAACPLVMDDAAGSVMLYTVTHEQLADATIAQVAVVRSTQADLEMAWIDADGPIVVNSECLPAGITTSASDQFAIQAATHAGQVCLILQHETTIYQYASSDGGYTFALVGTVTTPRISTADLAVVQGVFVLSYSEGINVKVRRVASAFDAFGDATAITVAKLKTSGSCGVTRLAVTDDDRLWLYAYDNDTGTNVYAYYSSAAGQSGSWVSIVTTSAGIIEGARVAQGAAFSLSNPGTRGGASWCVVPHRGRVGLLYRAVSATGTSVSSVNSLVITYLGGYADLVMPYRDERRNPLTRVSWSKLWLPHEHLSARFTESYDSGSSSGLTKSFLYDQEKLETDGSTAVKWQMTSGAMFTRGGGSLFGAAVAVTAGTATYFVSAQNSLNEYAIQVVHAPTSLTLSDPNGSGTIATATISAGMYEILMYVRDNVASVYYRAWADGDGSQWIRLGGSSSITAASAALAGIVRISLAASSALWARYVGGSLYGAAADRPHTSLGVGITPTGGTAREAPIGLSLTPRPQFLVDDVYLSGHGGPMHIGETWSVSPTSTYAVERAACGETYPSPRIRWRSSTTTDGMKIAYQLGTVAEKITASTWVVVIDGNLPACRFAWHDGSSWLSDIPLTRHISIAGTRAGHVITPTTSGVSKVTYVDADELIGGYVDMGAGDVRRIVENTAGAIAAPSSAGAASMTRIRVEGIDATEPASGTWRVVFPRSVHLIHTGSLGSYKGFRITITTSTDSAQPPPEGYFEASILAGPAWPVPYQHGRDTVRVHRPRAVTTEAADGTRRTHKLAEAEQVVELHWGNAPRNMADWYIDGTTADFFPAVPGGPQDTAEGETMSTLRAFVERYASSGAAVAYVATYDRTTGGGGTPEHLLTHRQYGAIVGTIEGEWRTQHAGHGEEQYTEVIRGGTVRIRSL